MNERLFSRGDLGAQLRYELSRAEDIVGAVTADDLLDRSDEEVVADLMSVRSVQSLRIQWEAAWSPGPQETRVDMQHNFSYGGAGEGRPVLVAADEVWIHVPFTGDPELFWLKPSSYNLNPPRATVGLDEITIMAAGVGLTAEQVASTFDSFQSAMSIYLSAQTSDVAQHNRVLEAALSAAVARRRARLLSQRNLAAALPFQVRPAATQATYSLPIRRTKVHLTRPRPSRPFEPEASLDNAIYEDVLTRVASFGRAVERTPLSVGALDEEGLRDHLLLLLNGTYEGQAAGEVFNRSGKTDILIRSGDRNVFVAECKVWNGQAKFVKGVNQLLSYLVWRDGKAAIILFIKGGNPTEIVRKADASISDHPACLRRFDSADPTLRIDYLLRSSADPARSVHTALLPMAIAGR